MITISTILFLIWSLLNAGMYVAIFRKKFGIMLPISFIGQVLCCLTFGVLWEDSLILPFYVSLVAFLITGIYFGRQFYIDNKKRDSFLKNFFSPAFFAYLIFFFFIIILERNRALTRTDDLMHWGLFVQDILNTGQLPLFLNGEGFTWFHSDYPQFFSVFEAFVMTVCRQGYVEWYGIFALVLFSWSLFLPLFDAIKGKKGIKIVLCVFCVFLIGFTISDVSPNQNMAMFYDGLSVDYVLGILIAFNLYLVYHFEFKRSSDYLVLSLSLCALVQTKQIAVCFYLMVLFALFLKQFKEKNRYKKTGWFFLLLPLGIFVVWETLVSVLHQSGQFQMGDLGFDLIGIYQGNSGETWQQLALLNYIDAILFMDLHHFIVPLPYFAMIAILLFCNLVLAYITKKKDGLQTSLILFLGAIGYAFVLMVSYVYLFGDNEGPALASFERYIQTYSLFCISFLLLHYGEDLFQGVKKTTCLVVMMLCFLVFVDISSFDTLGQNEPFTLDARAYELLEYEKQMVEGEKVLVISQFVDEFEVQYERNVFLRYYSAKELQRRAFDFFDFVSIAKKGEWSDLYTELVLVDGKEEFVGLLSDYAFVYHHSLNDYYIDLFESVSDAPLLNERLYRIHEEEGEIDFTLIDHENTIETTRGGTR